MISKITPQICKDGQYEGHVVMRMPDYDQRLEITEECADDDESEGEQKQTLKSKLRFIRKVAAKLPQYIESVEIKRLSDGFVFSSFDQMKYDTDMGQVISELAGVLVGKHLVNPKESVL